MSKNYSSLKFKDILSDDFKICLKVYWNNKCVYDAEAGSSDYDFIKNYFNRIIYKVNLEVVSIHHLIIYVEGE